MTDSKERVVVGSPESGEAAKSQGGGKAKTEDRKLTPSFLQEFLNNLKINALMKQAKPGSEKMASLVAIEEGLASDKVEVKQGALEKLDDLLKVRKLAEEQAEGMPVGKLVANVTVKPEILEKVQRVAATIDAHMAELEGGRVDQEHLKTLEAEINLLAAGLEMEGGAELAEGMSSKLQYMQTLAESRQKMKVDDPKYTTLDFYKDEFGPGEHGEVIKLRDVPSGEKSELQSRLEKYKQHVREELIGGSKEKLEKLSPDELLQRLEEASYWDEHFGDLFGHGKGEAHRGSKARNELRGLLIMVESQYTAALEKKLEEKLGGTGDRGVAVRLALQEELKNKKPYGRAKYDFEKNKQAGKTAYQMLEGEVAQRAGKIEQKIEKKSKYTVRNKDGSYGGSVERASSIDTEAVFHSVDEFENHVKKSQQESASSLNKNIEFIADIENRIGVDFSNPEFLMSLEDSQVRTQLIEEARQSGKLSDEELAKYGKFLDSLSKRIPGTGGEYGSRFSGVQKELDLLAKEAEKTGEYAPFMIKLQAYIDRVGLRETSSDFQFAIVMRQAKEIISRLNSDAGGKFDLFQESQFLPSITSLDEKTFYSISPKVMNQLRAKLELEGPMANWLAMQVDGKGGKRALSVAAFYQMLQEPDVAKRVIAAPINGADGRIMELWVEHVWGDGAKLVIDDPKPGEAPPMHIELADGAKIFDIDVNYFSMNADPKTDDKTKEKMKIADFLDQSMWMAHYAQKMWWYSGEWEAFARDFPGEMLQQGNKRLISIGAAFRDYGLEYGKFDVGYTELAKAGVLLQDFRTYKAGDVIVANMRHMLYDKGLATAKEGEDYGKAIFDAFAVRARISEEYKPISSLRSVDQIRLMGQLGEYSSFEAKWNWYKKQQEKIGRKGVPDASYIAGLRGKNFEELRGNDEGWFIQAEQIELLFEDLAEQRAKLGKLSWKSDVLHELMDRQQFVETGSHRERGGESLDEFLKNFQYTSVLSYSELRKGTDPLDYQKYSEAKMEAASMMTEVLNGVPSMEKLAELFTKMRSYMPPDQVVAWFNAFREKQVQLRTFVQPWSAYDIAMTDKEEWEMRRDRGEFDDKKTGARPEHPPSSIIGYNPATFNIKDDRGDKWNVTGADGFRVVRMKKEWGNHMWKTRKIPPLNAAEIELQNQVYVGNRWLMPETAEEILENSFGLSQFINKFYKDRGWDPNSKGAKLMKKYGTKAWLLLRQHPLFDDPVWAFWNILNELKEYGTEVQKEMVKDIAH